MSNNTATQPFTISDTAASRLAQIIAEDGRHGVFFRLEVLGGGCSGFQYKFSLDTKTTEDDVLITQALSNGGGKVTAAIDATSMEFVRGGQLDFVDELAGRYFQVHNPQASAACGCGTSFAI